MTTSLPIRLSLWILIVSLVVGPLLRTHAQTSGGGTSGGSTGGGGGIGSSGGIGSGGSGGSSGPFAGTVQSGFSGGSGTSTTPSTGGTAGSTTTVPSANNPFKATYINPYAAGQSLMGTSGTKTTTNKAFGQPVYSISTTTTTTSKTAGATTTTTGTGFTTVNQPRAPQYGTVLSDDVPFVIHQPRDLEAKLQNVIARSSALKSRNQIQAVAGIGGVFLTGRVATERERNLAEAIIRLTPGVANVENRIVVDGQP